MLTFSRAFRATAARRPLHLIGSSLPALPDQQGELRKSPSTAPWRGSLGAAGGALSLPLSLQLGLRALSTETTTKATPDALREATPDATPDALREATVPELLAMAGEAKDPRKRLDIWRAIAEKRNMRYQETGGLEEKELWQAAEKQVAELKEQLGLAAATAPAIQFLTLEELSAEARKWQQRDDRAAAEPPSSLERDGFPLVDREQPLQEIFRRLAGKPSSVRRELITIQSVSGGGKTRLLRDITLGSDDFRVAVAKDNLGSAFNAWRDGTLRLLVSFNGDTAFNEEDESSADQLLAWRLLFSFFAVDASDLREMHVRLNDVVRLLVQRSGKQRLVICVDEVRAVGAPERSKAVATALKGLRVHFGQDDVDVRVVISTLDVQLGVVRGTSQMDFEWTHLSPLTVEHALQFVSQDRVLGPDVRQCIFEVNGHPRSIEWLYHWEREPAVIRGRSTPMDFVVSKLQDGWLAKDLAMLRSHPELLEGLARAVLSSTKLPWEPHTSAPLCLNDVCWLLLNSRAAREYDAVPRLAPASLRALLDKLDDHLSAVARQLRLLVNPADRARASTWQSFEWFHARWLGLMLWAGVPLSSLYGTLPAEWALGEIPEEPVEPIPLVSETEIQLGVTYVMPDNCPAFDLLRVLPLTNGGFVYELTQCKFYQLDAHVSAPRALSNSMIVLDGLRERGEVIRQLCPAEGRNPAAPLATQVVIPRSVAGENVLLVLVGTFERAAGLKNEDEDAARVVTVNGDHLRALYGDTFWATPQFLALEAQKEERSKKKKGKKKKKGN